MQKQANPYDNLSNNKYWSSSISDWNDGTYRDLYNPKFSIDRNTKISTAGSCFAQHLTRNLKSRGYNFIDVEPAPPMLPDRLKNDFGYDMYSARHGNIYSSRQLLCLIQEAFGQRASEEPWENEGRFYDPLRPSIEPNGFGSAEEVRVLRQSHLASIRQMVRSSDLFLFTLGLTETWLSKDSGTAFQTCPGTAAGTFDEDKHVFINLKYTDILLDMQKVIFWMRRKNPNMKFVFTVSPVSMIATVADHHVVQANTYSKSVLRAVAGDLREQYDYVDYFPGYEIVTAPVSRGRAYLPNMRRIRDDAVHEVMNCFFAAHGDASAVGLAPAREDRSRIDLGLEESSKALALVCDEELLDRRVAR